MEQSRRPMMAETAGEEEEGGNGMHSDFNEKELEVSEILLNLGEIIAESESISLKKQQESELRNRKVQPLAFTVVWGAKKILAGNTRRNPPSPVSTCGGLPATMATPIPQVKAAQATSPDTPLNFSPGSESDCKSSSPSPRKKKRDELMQTVEELSECGKLLRKEVDAVTSYRNKLLAFNKKLKEQKQMVTATCARHDDTGAENSSLGIENSSDVRSGQPYRSTVVPRFQPQQPQPQLQFHSHVTNPMAMESYPQRQRGLQYQSPNAAVLAQVGPHMLASNAALGGTNQVGSSWQALDYDHARGGESRALVVARAAEARRHRMMINRQKLALKMKSKSHKYGSETGPLLMPVFGVEKLNS